MKRRYNIFLFFLAPIAFFISIGGGVMIYFDVKEIQNFHAKISMGKFYVMDTYIVSGDGGTKAGDIETIAGFMIDSINHKLIGFSNYDSTYFSEKKIFKYKSKNDSLNIEYNLEYTTWINEIGVQTSSWGELEYFKPEYKNFKKGDTLKVWYDSSMKNRGVDFISRYPTKQLLYESRLKHAVKNFLLFYIPVILIFIFRFASQTLRENKIRKYCFWAYFIYLCYFFGAFESIF